MTIAQISLFLARLLAGTGTFLVGVHLLTANIEQLATGRLKELFGRAAHKRLVNVGCLLYTSPSPRDLLRSRMPSSA